MFKVGKILSEISAIKFDKGGFFNKNLEISKTTTNNGFIEFYFDILNDRAVQSVLSSEELDQISTLIKLYSNFFPDSNERSLVHADFDPANIIVKKVDGTIEISGILDWEFSFSGSTLSDVANMLRYSHHMPECYQNSFLRGLKSSGYRLPDNWQTTIHLLNILSLLDCIRRSDPTNRPNQMNDIKALLINILNFFGVNYPKKAK